MREASRFWCIHRSRPIAKSDIFFDNFVGPNNANQHPHSTTRWKERRRRPAFDLDPTQTKKMMNNLPDRKQTARSHIKSGAPHRPTRLFPLTRQLSWLLTPLLLHTPIGPNQVTALSLVSGLYGAWLYTEGTVEAGITGSLFIVLCYALDNCDGEIARARGLTSKWGARFDDFTDWAVDTAFFLGLGYGVWHASGEAIWWWFALATAFGATVDYGVDISAYWTEDRDDSAKVPDDAKRDRPIMPDLTTKLIYVFHTLSRADFCFIVLGLSLVGFTWVLLPLAAVGAQAYWVTDIYKRMRGISSKR